MTTSEGDREARRRARLEAQRRARRRTKVRRSPVAALVLGIVVVAAIAAVAIGLLRRDDDEPDEPTFAKATRTGATVVEGAGPVTIGRTPPSYRVVYRLEEFTGPDAVVSTDKVWVRRPFESRLETWSGPPPGKERLSLQVGAFAARRNESTGSPKPVVIGVPPATAPSDVRLEPALQPALDAGLLERREVRKVLDRACQVYRSGSLLNASQLTAPTADEYAESCVDDAGVVLEELLVLDGRIVSRRIATEVEESTNPVVIPSSLFSTGARTLEVKDGGGLVRRMGPGLPPGDFLLIDPASIPAGFEWLGRYNVIPSQPENFSDPSRAGARETSFADVYVRGPDFVVVDQGGTLQGAPPFTVDEASPKVPMGAFGDAEVRLGGGGVEVRAIRPSGQFIRVRGTLPPADLAAVGAALRPTVGDGAMEFFEEPSGPTS